MVTYLEQLAYLVKRRVQRDFEVATCASRERPQGVAHWWTRGRLKRVYHPRSSLLIVVPVALALAGAAVAQAPPITITPSSPETPRWVGHVTVLAGNAAIGALTGAVLQKLRGGSFKDGFVRGALGGSVSYVGKRVAVQDFWGAGLLGREFNALGVSMVRNASDGVPTLSHLYLPLGPLPVRATFDLTHGFRVQPQLDIAATAWLTTGLLGSHLILNLAESFSSGAPVFEAEGRWLVDSEHSVLAYAVSRSVFLGDPGLYRGAPPPRAHVLAHERVHVLQQDFVLTAWSDPFARVALNRFGAGRWMQRYVAVDALAWVVGTASRLMYGANWGERFPTESEARFLTGH